MPRVHITCAQVALVTCAPWCAEQALLDDLQDNRLERTREMEWHVQRNCTKDPH
eukprot:COSAG03_NODE_2941_length_2340_cov_1.846051_3_plen_54_part_00